MVCEFVMWSLSISLPATTRCPLSPPKFSKFKTFFVGCWRRWGNMMCTFAFIKESIERESNHGLIWRAYGFPLIHVTMSRQAHLPPRCPFQRKPISWPIHDPTSPPANTNHGNVFPRHKKSPSQSAILEEQPAWLEDLLDDPNSSNKGVIHRRSASDSITLLDGLSDSLPAIKPNTAKQARGEREALGSLELDCIYGPNSPRQKGNLALPDNGIVSALSEYISQTSLQFLDGSLCISGMVNSDMKGDICVSTGDAETKTVKR